MKIAILKPHKEIPVLAGHPWIFSEAFAYSPEAENGEIVIVKTAEDKDLCIGTWNSRNSIRLRVLSRDTSVRIDDDFFVRQFTTLRNWKLSRLPQNTNGYRIVHAEADGIPGLIVDQYGDAIVFQIHTAGMELLREPILQALKKVFQPKILVERSDLDIRRIEGLSDQPVTIHQGSINEPIQFNETGIRFEADIIHGQKTGFFLDQREARRIVGRIAKGKRILNLFSYSGAFSVHAALGGTSFVMSVDVSVSALESAERQFRLNGLNPDDTTKYGFLEADIFDLMKEESAPEGPYDVIICDPPALAKSAAHLPQAKKTYTSLNAQCLRWLAPGGILLTSSCSGRLQPEDFRSLLRLASGRAKRDVRIVDWLPQPVDHAERLAYPEGRYLKTAILEVQSILR
ncbi:class I SAM-dependent rRNA methyltransferase [Candidatus Uhrbacteria bacterium]|nr:class I SAM-dependent rRNA methyltransferase [Candidatus Uhrbacteria bacterium]